MVKIKEEIMLDWLVNHVEGLNNKIRERERRAYTRIMDKLADEYINAMRHAKIRLIA